MINSNNENQEKLQKVTYQTHGTCSKYICISIDKDGKVQDAQFIGGCDGNTKGICSLIRGMKAKEIIARLKGITVAISLLAVQISWPQPCRKWDIKSVLGTEYILGTDYTEL